MRLFSLPRWRLPTLMVTPALVVGLVALPGVDTAPAPRPVEPSLQLVPLDGVESTTAAEESMPTERDGGVHTHSGDDHATAGTLRVSATSEPIDTDPFRLVALTWDDADVATSEVQGWVRYRSGGDWSAWHPLPTTDDHGPDPGSAEYRQQRSGTEPLVVPESDGIQLRVDTRGGAEVAGLRADLVDPGVSPADATAGTTPPGAATAAERPRILTRADWGADESLRSEVVDYGQVKAGFVHHTVNANDHSKADVPAIIRGIYAYHVVSRGWRDVGYNFLIDKWGRIWEGRHGGVDRPVMGAHTSGHNDDAFGASAIGTFTTSQPSTAMLDAFAALMAWKFALHGVDPQSTANLDGVAFRTIAGHRDASATACPGDRLYARLPGIRRAAALLSRNVSVTGLPGLMQRRQRASLDVTTSPPQRNVRAVVKRRQAGEQGWTTVRRGTLSREGTGTFTVRAPKAGTYWFRVKVKTDPSLRSRRQKVTVVDTTVLRRPDDGTFRVVGRGSGHGRGLSQWGARGAAEEGLREPRITRAYYPGTTRSARGGNPMIRVLLTADTGPDAIVRPERGLAITYFHADGTTRRGELPRRVQGCPVRWWRVVAQNGDVSIQALCGSSYLTWRRAAVVDGSRPVTFTTNDALIDVARRLDSGGFDRRAYRGSIEIRLRGSQLRVVNAVRLDHYLRSVVPAEMPASWPREALKAQAVAARTFAIHESRSRTGDFDVYDTTASQVYPGARSYSSDWSVVEDHHDQRTTRAVKATAKLHLRWDGAPARTEFSASNGGFSAPGGRPYLPARRDSWDAANGANPWTQWSRVVRVRSLEAAYPQIGRLRSLSVVESSGMGRWDGRVVALAIGGTKGTVTVEGDLNVRRALDAPSNYLTIRD